MGLITNSDPPQTWYVCESHTSEYIAETLDNFEPDLQKDLPA
ncbi:MULTISPECIES: hypothetical protein [unclassified Nodularia (in: cyanobacteria)]|nr:hypothetical protein [Nodularia sp. LEGE 04288]